jgi:hypothetical protein
VIALFGKHLQGRVYDALPRMLRLLLLSLHGTD